MNAFGMENMNYRKIAVNFLIILEGASSTSFRRYFLITCLGILMESIVMVIYFVTVRCVYVQCSSSGFFFQFYIHSLYLFEFWKTQFQRFILIQN